MERYSEYKDSGVQWLGKIPGHWKQFQFRKFFKIKKVIAGKEGFDVLAITQQGIKIKDITRNEGQLAANYSGYQIVNPTDFAMNHMDLLTGYIDISKYYGVTSPDYRVFTNISEEADGKYYLYIFQLCYKRKIFFGLGQGVANKGRWRLPAVQLNKFYLPLPPLSEQHSIVSYLDDKCGKIDKMLEGKQKQIELLAEMKQRIIADAVTHGLKPDVKMKATNIPWLPEIPEHWELCRLKSLFSQRTESYNPNEQLEVLSLLKDVGVIPYSEKGNVGNKAKEDFSSYRIARKGDVIMNSMNVIIGSVDITQYDGYISPAYYALTAKHGVSTEYYNYIFHMKACQKHMRSLANGILEIRLRISATSLFGMYYPVPPQEEQIAIVSFINEKVVKIDTLTSKLQQEIESVKEYKQRLISDVVTGQIKVC